MLFIAEIGLNHNGNFDLAYELIRQAKHAGASIAKFQFGWRNKPDEINHIDSARAHRLKQWCSDLEIEMMASLITEEGLNLVREIDLPRYKIASRTVVDNPRLCEQILSDGKETFVSLGMYEGKNWPMGEPDERLRYLYCRSKYPTYPRDLVGFPNRFSRNGYTGYSDHAHGLSACYLAIARGATVIEKHFTLDKSSSGIRDHVLSATPDEFRLLVTIGSEIGGLVRSLGTAEPTAKA